MFLHFVLCCLKPLALTFLCEILEILISLLLFPHIKVVVLLDVHQQQITFAKILIYSGNDWLYFIIFQSNFVMLLVLFCFFMNIICLLLLLYLFFLCLFCAVSVIDHLTVHAAR
jgi:hypothetical protein